MGLKSIIKQSVWLKYIGLVTVILFTLLSTYNFIKVSSLVTDENIFFDSPSQMYLTENLSVVNKSGGFDTLEPGALLINLNNIAISNPKEFNLAISSLAVFDTVNITIHYSKSNDNITHRVATKYINNNLFADIGKTFVVHDISKGGASEAAGLKEGDLISTVNSKHFNSAIHAFAYIQTLSPGSIITYEVLRQGELLKFNIKLSKFGLNLEYLGLFLCGLFSMFVGMFFIYKSYKLATANLIGWALILYGITFSYVLSFNLVEPFWLRIVRVVLTTITFHFSLPLFFQSSIYFPNLVATIANKKFLLFTPYLIGILSTLISIIAWSIDENIFGNLVVLITPVIQVVYFLIIRIVYFKDFRTSNRRAGKTLVVAWLLFAVAIILQYTPQYYRIFELQAIGIYMLLVIPLAYLYVVARYRLLNLNIRLRRNIQYSLIVLAIRLIFIMCFGYLIYLLSLFTDYTPNLHFTGKTIEVLDNPLKPEMQLIYDKLLLVICAFVLSLLFLYVFRKIQKLLDNKFYRGNLDFNDISKELSSNFIQNKSLDELSKVISHFIQKAIKIEKCIVVLYKEREKPIIVSFSGFDSMSLKEFLNAISITLYDSLSEYKSLTSIHNLSIGIKSIFEQYKLTYIVPVISKSKLVGCIITGEKLSETEYSAEDINYINTISSQVSVAVENSLLYENLASRERIKHELDIARRIQLASLPTYIPDLEGLDISGLSLPALEVGGDFYDFLIHKNKDLTIVMGDVSGKGTSAALYMSKIQGIIKTLHEFDLNPKDLLSRANTLIYSYLEKSSFISAIACKLDFLKKKMLVARAGHQPLYYFNSLTRELIDYSPKGFVLGMTNNGTFEANLEEIEIKYNSGDLLVFITDGITEARNDKNEEYEEGRLRNLIISKSHNSSEEIRNILLNDVQDFSRNLDQYDDLSIVVVKFK